MSARFSIVYPTRHRPEFIRQALRILELQRHRDFEVIVCDNFVDPALSCEAVCTESTLANLTYVRPPRPLGMVENWNHVLPAAAGDYVCFLTDKMFVLPDALERVERAVEAAGAPDIVSWTSDFYYPASFANYFGEGSYARLAPRLGSDQMRPFSPADELDHRGEGEVSRNEQSAADYCRGKLVFGAYRHELIQRTVHRFGALFHNINPDYTSMVLGLSEAKDAIELAHSCVVSVNTDISNGVLCDTNDAVALAFLNSLTGGADGILPNLPVPGLYASLHNWVAHDYLSLKQAYSLPFRFSTVNWLVYCIEDIHRPDRQWSDPRVETEQKRLLREFLAGLDPATAAAVQARIAARPRSPRPPLLRRLIRRTVPHAWRRSWRRWAQPPSPSMIEAIAHSSGRST